MQKSFIKPFILIAVTALAMLLSPSGLAQVTTTGLAGRVTSDDGKAIAGASVSLVHVPTNTSYRTSTNSDGRYSFSGLPVGGPYKVSVAADGYGAVDQDDINPELASHGPVHL